MPAAAVNTDTNRNSAIGDTDDPAANTDPHRIADAAAQRDTNDNTHP